MSSEEALVVVTSNVRTSIVQSLEAPSTQLPGEGSEFGLTKEFGDHFFHEERLVEHFPGTAVRLVVIECEKGAFECKTRQLC
jgi:hypothetical protein